MFRLHFNLCIFFHVTSSSPLFFFVFLLSSELPTQALLCCVLSTWTCWTYCFFSFFFLSFPVPVSCVLHPWPKHLSFLILTFDLQMNSMLRSWNTRPLVRSWIMHSMIWPPYRCFYAPEVLELNIMSANCDWQLSRSIKRCCSA